MFKPMHMRQSYSYAVTCTYILCILIVGTLYPRQQAGTAPPLHMQMLAHPPR